MIAREYIEGDLFKMSYRKCDAVGDLTQQIKVCDVFTFVENGKVVAVAGFGTFWGGVKHLWAVISDDARGHGKGLTRSFIALYKQYFKEKGLHRIQATVDTDNLEYNRWAEAVGFSLEVRCKRGLPDGRDYNMYIYLGES